MIICIAFDLVWTFWIVSFCLFGLAFILFGQFRLFVLILGFVWTVWIICIVSIVCIDCWICLDCFNCLYRSDCLDLLFVLLGLCGLFFGLLHRLECVYCFLDLFEPFGFVVLS